MINRDKYTTLRNQMNHFIQTENDLRKELNDYTEKLRQAEETIHRSNELFMSFRKEMDHVSHMIMIFYC
jgi:uncharacterized coiled-coil DUF342 family protein